MRRSALGIIAKTMITGAVGLGALLGGWALAGALTWSDVSRVLWSLLGVGPVVALGIGVGAAAWGLSLWPALVASLAANVIGLTLRFREDALAYLPVYLALTAAGLALGHVVRQGIRGRGG